MKLRSTNRLVKHIGGGVRLQRCDGASCSGDLTVPRDVSEGACTLVVAQGLQLTSACGSSQA
jgi:hypothetical protein